MEKYKFLIVHPNQSVVLTRGIKKMPILYKGVTKIIDMPGWYSEDYSIGQHCKEDFELLDRERTILKEAVQKAYQDLKKEKVV